MRVFLLLLLPAILGGSSIHKERGRTEYRCDLCDEPCFSGAVPQKYRTAYRKGEFYDSSD